MVVGLVWWDGGVMAVDTVGSLNDDLAEFAGDVYRWLLYRGPIHRGAAVFRRKQRPGTQYKIVVRIKEIRSTRSAAGCPQLCRTGASVFRCDTSRP